MSVTGQFAVTGVVQGKSYSVQDSVVSNGAEQFDISCALGYTGSLTTRTNNTDGTVTMTSNTHGITTAEVVDLYWAGGQRRGVVVGSVVGTAVPISGGSGTALPVANTNVTVSPTSSISVGINGTNVQSIVVDVNASAEGMFSLLASGTEVVGARLNSATGDYIWFSGNGVTNPVTGNTIDEIRVSTANTTTNTTVRGSIQYN